MASAFAVASPRKSAPYHTNDGGKKDARKNARIDTRDQLGHVFHQRLRPQINASAPHDGRRRALKGEYPRKEEQVHRERDSRSECRCRWGPLTLDPSQSAELWIL